MVQNGASTESEPSGLFLAKRWYFAKWEQPPMFCQNADDKYRSIIVMPIIVSPTICAAYHGDHPPRLDHLIIKLAKHKSSFVCESGTWALLFVRVPAMIIQFIAWGLAWRWYRIYPNPSVPLRCTSSRWHSKRVQKS